MRNLPASIKSFFLNLSPDDLLSAMKGLNAEQLLSKADFTKLTYNDSEFTSHSPNEIKNVFYKLNEDWFIDPYISNNWQNGALNKNYFHLLNHFTQNVLIEENLEPFVVYSKLLEWRDLSHQIGEDMLTTSYLAYCDIQSRRNRSFFAWRTTAFSNNKRLRILLQKGMAENHFHLQGSGPIFPLTWINLMNNPFARENREKYREFDKKIKLSGLRNDLSSKQPELKILIYKAAYIRVKLFKIIQKLKTNPDSEYCKNEFAEYDITKPSNEEDSFSIINKMAEIEGEIRSLKLEGHKFYYKNNEETMDYAIPSYVHEKNLDKALFLYGERKFLYDCFQLIYSENKRFKKYWTYFHSYLLIKSRFRAELIHTNSKSGFDNFSEYQDRKSYFLPKKSIYYATLFNKAVNESKSHQKLDSFELRFTPKESAKELAEVLNRFNKVINPKAIVSHQAYNNLANLTPDTYHLSDDNIFFTTHFIKQDEHDSDENDLIEGNRSRNIKTREKVKKQALAIVSLRDNEIQIEENKKSWSQLIKGIDAASNEFNARPEVFAQAFRFLKGHQLRGEVNNLRTNIDENKIAATFHAGEDFYDIVDGLRTIDEVIHFLDYRRGDRIGHALALGVNPEEYYSFKKNMLTLPKQMLLDNLAWLLARVRKFGLEGNYAEVSRLEKLFSNLFSEVYMHNFKDYDPVFSNHAYSLTHYFDAWKLRGDDPYRYKSEIKDELEDNANLTYWERCAINQRYPKNSNIRKDKFVRFLYQQYHFNPQVKRCGEKISQFPITTEYIKLVQAVQKGMQHVMREKNIAIETNPSSNYLIGTFKDYSKHPLVNFYNLDLETDMEKIKECPQLFVSINTDDQGVFSTSLENDYALIASALEQVKDEHGQAKYKPSMIYRWLDNIREMGLEQSFNKSKYNE